MDQICFIKQLNLRRKWQNICRNRQGYGKAVVEALIKYAKNNHLDSISLEVRESNTPAITLYRELGFKVEGKRKDFYTKPTEAALVMVLRIK